MSFKAFTSLQYNIVQQYGMMWSPFDRLYTTKLSHQGNTELMPLKESVDEYVV